MTHATARRFVVLAITLALAAGATGTGFGAEPVQLTLKDHHFEPAAISAPPNERFRIEVANQDPTPAEFESSDLRAEKIIVPGGRISVMVGPLKPGSYAFFDDYNPDLAKGILTVTDQPAKD
jgi:Cupredoxin-like domain